ncbi:MAG: manganese efflux pump [Spirochaetales bacterium]|nr:manganese efflux pump [Spirochaetales bacterium]
MEWDFVFFLNSVLLGVGLAMDAFSVSLANGLNEPGMKRGRMNMIAGMYSFFQFAMPMIGWVCVHTIVEKFQAFEKFIPWIALLILSYIGGEMIMKGIRKEESSREEETGLPFGKLVIQGVATSLDALSVGFTIEQYPVSMAVAASAIIAVVTHFICIAGLLIGKRFGNRLADKASIFGGIILVGIGIEILVSHLV